MKLIVYLYPQVKIAVLYVEKKDHCLMSCSWSLATIPMEGTSLPTPC